MATQFYRTLDDIVKLKQENERQLQVSETTHINSTSFNEELASLKSNLRLMGVDSSLAERSIEEESIDRSRRIRFIQEHNIKPGTPRWFRVMYARPEITGEDPYGE
jgi:hypothetical protein